jgi:RHS repeat-associated protein
MTSLTYPSGNNPLSYQYDPMGNLSAITQSTCAHYNDDGSCDAQQNPNVANATYNFAGQLTTLSYGGGIQESRTYDSQLRLTSIVTGGYQQPMLNMRYNYSTTGDNGRLTSTVDGISGETVTYAYDQLNRLASATSSSGSWGQQYSYDGFGNLTGTNGSATWSFDPATNHQSNTPADANGNALPTNTWDVENRLVTVAGVFYAYDPWGKRVSQTSTTTDGSGNVSTQTVVYFYGITGQRLQTFNFNTDPNGNTTGGAVGANLYFGKKLIGNSAGAVATDRLGSVRAVASTNLTLMSYYPYGQERPQSNGQTTPNGTDKFATYFRDAVGQDYADQRYYNPETGRFFSPDPAGLAAVNAKNPLSWNRYIYSLDDPINKTDPTGRTCVNENGTWVDNGDGDGCAEAGQKVGSEYLDPGITFSNSCNLGETVIKGSCDVALPGMAQQVFGQASQNLQGFESFMATFAVGSAGAGYAIAEYLGALELTAGADSIMLGSSGYVEIGGAVGADALNIPTAVWQSWSVAEQESAMSGFIDSALNRGAQIVFTNDPALAQAGSGLAYEYQYILDLGYKIVQSGTSWIVQIP